MENFNGLQQWNTESDRIKELVNLEKEMGDPDNLVIKYQKELRAHLMKPFVKVAFRVGTTPGSASLGTTNVEAPVPVPIDEPTIDEPTSPLRSRPSSPILNWNGESNTDFEYI